MKKLLILLCVALALAPAALSEAVERELSGYFGQDIAKAAGEIGNLTFSAGDEYAENYEGDSLALRGNGGRVALIDLRGVPCEDALCGVKLGMARADVEALMGGHPVLWDYPEELAFTVRADPENELNNENLVVFFDEDGLVNGAWYRASGE